MLTIIVPFTYGNGAWFVDAAGNWSDTTKWTRACPAGGAGLTADFSILDISANRTVTLDSSRSIGAMKFADYSGSQAWTLAASGGSVLTLDTGSAASPAIVRRLRRRLWPQQCRDDFRVARRHERFLQERLGQSDFDRRQSAFRHAEH